MTRTGEKFDSPDIQAHLAVLAGGGDTAAVEAARAALVSVAVERMLSLARRMLAGSPHLRRWTETDDIVQGALMRLYRALGAVVPNDAQHFIRLSSLQVRRELIDLTRRLSNPDSFASKHETNSIEGSRQRSDVAICEITDDTARLAEWTRFHETVGSLPEAERELFEMVWYIGLSQDDISKVLGCSPRTVRRRWEEAKNVFSTAFLGEAPD
jgi:RNA polymerase sigma factor (sigma-70 family)